MRHANKSRRRREGGFTLVEAICAAVILAIAILGHVASTVSEHKMAHDGQYRSEALHVARQFIERLRADEDFEGLFARLRSIQVTTTTTTTTTTESPTLGLTGGTTTTETTTTTGTPIPGTLLEDGRMAYPPTIYYPDFLLPSELDSMVIRVEVPIVSETNPILCENIVDPFCGLPADLNGDATIDSDARDSDYRALPLSLTFQWQAPGHPQAVLRLSTWLRSKR